MDSPAQGKGENSPFLPLLASLGPSMDWMILVSLLGQLSHMLMSSRNALTDIARFVLPAIWASLTAAKLTQKLTIPACIVKCRSLGSETGRGDMPSI